jgi:signal transduction histidine kinase
MSISVHEPAVDVRRTPESLSRFARRSAALARSAGAEAVLDQLAAEVRPLTRMRTCAVVLIDAASGPLRRAGVSGLPVDYVERLEAGRRRGAFMATREAFLTGRPVLTPHCRDDVLRDARWSAAHDLVRDEDWDAFLAVPLFVRGRAIGSLTGFFGRDGAPDEAEVRWIAALAEHVALAADDAVTLARLRIEATEAERGRLARDLHDSVAQLLYSLSASTRALELQAEPESRFAADLGELRALAHSALAAMRGAIDARRPLELNGEDLAAAMRQFAAVISERTGLAVEVVCTELPPLPPGLEEDAFRLVQEAVNNAVKHARARAVLIVLRGDGDAMELSVTDDGVGPGGTAPGSGHGMQIMRERVARHGGSLTISEADPGTVVRLRLPLG